MTTEDSRLADLERVRDLLQDHNARRLWEANSTGNRADVLQIKCEAWATANGMVLISFAHPYKRPDIIEMWDVYLPANSSASSAGTIMDVVAFLSKTR